MRIVQSVEASRAMCCGLKARVRFSAWQEISVHLSVQAPVPIQWLPSVPSPGLKQQETEADHSSPL
jgi:hypothetical protein